MKNSHSFYQRLIQCILLVLFFTNLNPAQAQTQAPTIQWQKMLGGNGDDYAYLTQQTADGGYIMVGYTWSSNSGDVGLNHGGSDMWLVKMTALGAIQWQKVIGGAGDEQVYGLQQTTDGGYIVIGMTTSSNSGDVTAVNHGGQDAWVVKLDATGTIQWQKVMGGSGDERAFAVQKTTDGGCIVAASTTSSNSGDIGLNHGTYDGWVIKLNATGTVQWQKLYGGSSDEEFYDVQQTTDGGYILAGYTSSSGSGDVTGVNRGIADYWVVKLDATGALVWQKNMGGSSNEKAHGVVQATDGGYVIVGFTSSSNSGDVGANHGAYDTWLVKLDATGTLQWQKVQGGSADEFVQFIHKTTDGGYMVSGFTQSSNSGDVGVGRGESDYWVVKLSGLGAIQWQKVLGGSAADDGLSAYPTTDGGYIVSGYSSSPISGDVTATKHPLTEVWLVKLACPTPCTSPVEQIADGVNNLTVYPTIVTDGLLNVEGIENLKNRDGGTFLIYNLLGQIVLGGKMAAQINVSSLPQGCFILKMGSEQAQFVKQ